MSPEGPNLPFTPAFLLTSLLAFLSCSHLHGSNMYNAVSRHSVGMLELASAWTCSCLLYLAPICVCRLFQRLMSPEGPNLRRYYLPGLEHLKIELSCFELLLSSHQPLLHQHLLDAGLPALLYAAQWLMTTYSCPFPMHVSVSLPLSLGRTIQTRPVSLSVRVTFDAGSTRCVFASQALRSVPFSRPQQLACCEVYSDLCAHSG
jgi:hypothetical protein